MTLADYAQTTLKGAQANAVAAVTSQIVDLNNNLKSSYLTAFNNWLINWTASPIPEIPKPFVPPVLPEPANIRNVPGGDTMPVGYQLLAPDGGKWQKQASPTPFGMAYYYAKLG